jgi:uncharacterized protein GlcG (DUF336 family)
MLSNFAIRWEEFSIKTNKGRRRNSVMKPITKAVKMVFSGVALSMVSGMAYAAAPCAGGVDHAALKAALDASGATDKGLNGGFGLNMWGTVVNRNGVVCAVAFTGNNKGDQWPGSRVISAAKAYTANAYSLPNLALSTANLYASNQPGGSLFGLQHSNPVNPDNAAYKGPASKWGTAEDPLVGQRIGGEIIFGGGFALYNAAGKLVGAVGVSGDTSCKDHNFGWRVRQALGLDHVPAGVNSDPKRPDNVIYDMGAASEGNIKSPSGFGHVACKKLF